MNRRTALAACAALVFAVTGTVTARHWIDKPASCGYPGEDRKRDWWYFEGHFRGKATLSRADGTEINSMPVQGNNPNAPLKVVFSKTGKGEIARAEIQGMGRHDIKDATGVLHGYLTLSPLTKTEEDEVKRNTDMIRQAFEDFYRRPERVTPSGISHGFYHVVALPGVVGGYFSEDISVNGEKMSYTHPASWKVYGEARVTARLQTIPQTIVVPGEMPAQKFKVPLKGRTLVEKASSKRIPTAQERSAVPSEERAFLQHLPLEANKEPVVYWTLAGTSGDDLGPLDPENGEWKNIRLSGKRTGYGIHKIKDEDGRVVLVLEVAPLTAPVTTR